MDRQFERDVSIFYRRMAADIILALRSHGMTPNPRWSRRIAWLMHFHKTKNGVILNPRQAVTLLQTEIAEEIVQTKGRGHVHLAWPGSMN